MKCPYCSEEMIVGVVQSAREIYFAPKPHKFLFEADINKKDEIVLNEPSLLAGTCTALHCPKCKKVVIDYSSWQRQKNEDGSDKTNL